MDFFTIAFMAAGLSLDAFAVALGISSSGRAGGYGDSFRLAFHFGLFQFLMPVLGWWAGYTVEPLIEHFDHWVAFGLLALVGVRMIRAGLSGEPPHVGLNPTRGRLLIVLSVATSVDALAIGLSLAFIGVDVIFPGTVIGLVTFVMTYIGMRGGSWLGSRYGRKMEIVGGVVLVGIGVKILVSHLL